MRKPISYQTRPVHDWAVALVFFCLLAGGLSAGIETDARWVKDKLIATLSLTDAGNLPDGDLPVQLMLYDKNGVFIWEASRVIVVQGGAAEPMKVALDAAKEPKSGYRLDVMTAANQTAIRQQSRVQIFRSGSTVQTLSIDRTGRFPDEQVAMNITVGRLQADTVKALELMLKIADRDDNTVLETVANLPTGKARQRHTVNVTPDAPNLVGPFNITAEIENDAASVYFSWSDVLPYGNRLVPVSSMESGPGMWFLNDTNPYALRSGHTPSTNIFPDFKAPKRPPANRRTYTRYYSPQLMRDRPAAYPDIVYDRAVFRSGQQALRVDYEAGKAAHVYSMQTLPGFPTHAYLWVKGNGTADKLVLHWVDSTDLSRPGWGRSISWRYEPVCELNFEGWQRFEVPVLGEGRQVRGASGNTTNVDVPVQLFAISVHPTKDGGQRSLWIDDLLVESQVGPDEELQVELRADSDDQHLHRDATLSVAIGNGTLNDIDEGQIRLRVTAPNGELVYQANHGFQVKAGAFTQQEIALGPVVAKSVAGPIDVDVVVVDSKSGTRRSARMTFKNAGHTAVYWDFEQDRSYSGMSFGKRISVGGPVASTATPGVGDRGRALKIDLAKASPTETGKATKKDEPPPLPESAVLLHPAVPGAVDQVDMMVRCTSAEPVDVEVALIDAGRTGVSGKNMNVFWCGRTRVAGDSWQSISVVAPPIPAHYQDKSRPFLRKPTYPLNVAIRAIGVQNVAAGIAVDDIKVRTHLEPEQAVQVALAYPDDAQLFAPGAPLAVDVRNFNDTDLAYDCKFELTAFDGRVVERGKIAISAKAGARHRQQLIAKAPRGHFMLTVTRPNGAALVVPVHVIATEQAFGPGGMETIQNLPEIRRTLDMLDEDIYLDWDNSEPVPGLYHDNWFNTQVAAKSAGGSYRMRPVVGFAADWAGTEAQEAIADGSYVRYMANNLQRPVRMRDWSAFTRMTARRYQGQFKHWVFWENPDLEDAPQSLPPEAYPEMLRIFKKWIALYSPKSKVVAGGLNIDNTLGYLERMEKPDSLAFDEIAIRANLAELSPEEADLEGFLDELNGLLKLKETGRSAELTELDWGIGQYVSLAEQTAYHVRAALILNSRGARPHRFDFVNVTGSIEGYGVLYRSRYGNTENLPIFKPHYLAKPAFFALKQTQTFLSQQQFRKSVFLPDADRGANRVYLYQDVAGRVTAALWRTKRSTRDYRRPKAWQQVKAVDVFGVEVPLTEQVVAAPMPLFLTFPKGYALADVAYDFRTLSPVDGKAQVVMDLYLAERETCERHAYRATGTRKAVARSGKLPAGVQVNEPFYKGLESESFEFTLAQAGDVLLSRRWYFEDGQVLAVTLNGEESGTWQLAKGQIEQSGVRESTFVLRNCVAGVNRVAIKYQTPGNCAGYQARPLTAPSVKLTDWGMLSAAQTKGDVQRFKNARGTALNIGKKTFANGLGAHSVSYLELPVNEQFTSFEVTVGIDAVTEGRGSVIFEIHADGQLKASSGVMNGFSEAKTLTVDGLGAVKRLVLLVQDAGDGNDDDVANWVDGKLVLK